MSSIEQRLSKLERQNRYLKVASLLSCGFVVSICTMGAVAPETIRGVLKVEKIDIIDGEKTVGSITKDGIKFNSFGSLSEGEIALNAGKTSFADVKVNYQKDANGSLMLLGGGWGQATGLWDNTQGSMIVCNNDSLRLVSHDNGKNLGTFTKDGDLVLGAPDDPSASLKKTAELAARLETAVKAIQVRLNINQ